MELYSTGKVAKMLGVHRVTINRWIRDGKIRAVRIGKEYRIPEDEVRRLLGGKSPNNEFFSSRGVRIEALFSEEPRNLRQELVEDLISIATSFAGRSYGMRSHKRREVVECVRRAVEDR